IQKDWRPLLYGGGMVEEVNEEGTRYLEGPRKFEAGTPNVTGAVGFAAACEYIDRIGRGHIQKQERELTSYLLQRLSVFSDVYVFAKTEEKRIGVVSLKVSGVHPHDVAQALSDQGIAVRAGSH